VSTNARGSSGSFTVRVSFLARPELSAVVATKRTTIGAAVVKTSAREPPRLAERILKDSVWVFGSPIEESAGRKKAPESWRKSFMQSILAHHPPERLAVLRCTKAVPLDTQTFKLRGSCDNLSHVPKSKLECLGGVMSWSLE